MKNPFKITLSCITEDTENTMTNTDVVVNRIAYWRAKRRIEKYAKKVNGTHRVSQVFIYHEVHCLDIRQTKLKILLWSNELDRVQMEIGNDTEGYSVVIPKNAFGYLCERVNLSKNQIRELCASINRILQIKYLKDDTK